MKRYYLALLALLLPVVSYAEGTTAGAVFNVLNPPAISNGTDLSIDYLQNIFGVVPGILHGSGSQIMGQMFMIFNAGALVLGGVIIIYTLFISTLNTAHEGEMLGRRWNSIWIPLRSVLGIGLLIPQATGYSMIQILMMWIIVQGVGLADSVWNAATSYLARGGVVVQQSLAASNTMGNTAQEVFRMQVCLYGLQAALNASNAARKTPETVPNLVATMNPLPKNCDKGSGNSSKGITCLVSVPGDLSAYASQWHDLTGVCGTVKWNEVDPQTWANIKTTQTGAAMGAIIADFDNLGSQIIQSGLSGLSGGGFSHNTGGDKERFTHMDHLILLLLESKYLGMQQIFLDTAGPAQTVVNNQLHYSGTPSLNNVIMRTKPPSLSSYLNSRMFINTAEDYEGITYPAERLIVDVTSNTLNRVWIATARKQGWITAGSYYQEMANLNDNANEAIFTAPTVSNMGSTTAVNKRFTAAIPVGFGSNVGSLASLLGSKTSALNHFIASSPNSDAAYGGKKLTLPSFGGVDTRLAGVLGVFATPVIGPLVQLLVAFVELATAQNNNSNPILLLAMMGSSMLTLVTEVWIAGALAIGAVTGVLGTVPSLTLSAGPLAILQWAVPFLWAILGVLFVEGSVLTFYIPLIPFIIFLFGAIGWILATLEAMVAAPLVALGITHPEGEAVLGKADPAVLLIVNVFMRPSMMIIGLIGGIILSYVSVWLLNEGFFGAFFVSMISNVSGLALIFAIPAILIIYTVIIISLMNFSFSLINVIPDKVMRWIGGQQEGVAGEVGKMMGETQSGFRSGAQAVATGGTKLGEALGSQADKRGGAKAKGLDDDGGSTVQSAASIIV